MPRFKGFKFSFNLSSGNKLQSELSENNFSPVYITGAYKVTGEQFYGTGSYGESPKKITPAMVKLPSFFQPEPTDPDIIKASKSTSDLHSPKLQNLPPNLRKSMPEVSADPRGGTANERQSTDLRNTNTTDSKNNKKDQNKLNKKKITEQKKKQEKLEAQQRAKEEALRKERQKTELKEQAKQEKIRLQKEKTEKAKAKKEVKKPPKTRTNPLAQGPNAPLPYQTNTLQSSISKASGPPPYEANTPPAIEARNVSSSNSEVTQNDNDGTGNTSFGTPIDSGSTWDMVAQHRAQVTRTPLGGAAGKVTIRLQEPLDPNTTAVTGRKSLYV